MNKEKLIVRQPFAHIDFIRGVVSRWRLERDEELQKYLEKFVNPTPFNQAVLLGTVLRSGSMSMKNMAGDFDPEIALDNIANVTAWAQKHKEKLAKSTVPQRLANEALQALQECKNSLDQGLPLQNPNLRQAIRLAMRNREILEAASWIYEKAECPFVSKDILEKIDNIGSQIASAFLEKNQTISQHPLFTERGYLLPGTWWILLETGKSHPSFATDDNT